MITRWRELSEAEDGLDFLLMCEEIDEIHTMELDPEDKLDRMVEGARTLLNS